MDALVLSIQVSFVMHWTPLQMAKSFSQARQLALWQPTPASLAMHLLEMRDEHVKMMEVGLDQLQFVQVC